MYKPTTAELESMRDALRNYGDNWLSAPELAGWSIDDINRVIVYLGGKPIGAV